MLKTKNGLKHLDKFAYDVVCNWFKEINFNPVYNQIDYSLIIRFYLWDKVGRSLRISNNVSFNEIEAYKLEYQNFPFYYTPSISNGTYKKRFRFNKKVIFIPFNGPHTQQLVRYFQELKLFKILSKQTTILLGKHNVVKSLKVEQDLNWSNTLFNAVVHGLQEMGISLIDEDYGLLADQIKGTISITNLALVELKKYKPHALYVHSDNHPPYVNYVLVAKKLGIPTFTYQHGLDCEHFFLEDCFADYVAVWSEHRKNEYVNKSSVQPRAYGVVGNIFLDKNEPLQTRDSSKKVLFLTRPHKPIKCYSPSRNYLEGAQILKAIAHFLINNKDVSLVIKPHPMDILEPYHDVLKKFDLEDRVSFSDSNLKQLFSQVDAVITEDSTSGVEAIRKNLPCIHAHFANSNPVLSFGEYKAALLARSSQELIQSLNKIFDLTPEEKEHMRKGQNAMVQDYIPNGDINSLCNFIIENM